MIEQLVKLKDYVPLFQTIFWIGFILSIILIFRKSLKLLINILIDRVKKGSSVKAGFIEIGEELKNMEYAKQVSIDADISIDADGQEREEHRVKIYEKHKGLFITHLIYPSLMEDQRFEIFIYLIRHKLDNFSDIDKATFFFGHMWGNQVFTETIKNGMIGISTSAYKPFLCTCCVRFKNGDEIQLDRYIDLEIAKIYRKIK